MAIPLQEEDENSAELSIKELVRDRCSPELEALYLKMVGVFFQSNVRFHLDELDLLWGMLNDQNIDPTEIVPSVDAVLRMAAERALTICGVEFDSEIPFEYLVEACDIILNFDPTDTPTVLLDALDASEDDEESLVKILSILGTFEEEEWYPYMGDIAEGFYTRLRSVVAHEVEQIENTQDVPFGTQEQLKRLARLVKINRDSLGAELGSINAGLGASMESLYGCHVDKLLDLSVEHQVEALFSLAAISNESYEKAMTSISTSLDDLILDMDQRRIAERETRRMSETYRPVFGDDHA